MNKYDKRNSWNLEVDSWFKIISETIGSILFLSCLFGSVYLAFMTGYIILEK